MDLWNKWRQKWIKDHQIMFTAEEELKYMQDWVANYEISDWVEKEQSNKQIGFVRRIENDFASLTHEEKERVDEEIPFRNKYSLFMDDPFLSASPNSKLWCPEDWVREFHKNPTPRVFVVDVGGHFVAAKPIRIREGDSCTPVMLVINSYTPNCLPNTIISSLYSLFFEQDASSCFINKQ